MSSVFQLVAWSLYRLRSTYLNVVVIIRVVDNCLYCPMNITAVLKVGDIGRSATDLEHCRSVGLSFMKAPVQLMYARRQHQSTAPEQCEVDIFSKLTLILKCLYSVVSSFRQW
jgi:hypothetical protein